MNTPFAVFSELIEILPLDRFISISSLQIPASDSLDHMNIPDTPEELKESFNARFKGRLKIITGTITKNYNTNKDYIKQLELTQNYITYKYILSLSFKSR